MFPISSLSVCFLVLLFITIAGFIVLIINITVIIVVTFQYSCGLESICTRKAVLPSMESNHSDGFVLAILAASSGSINQINVTD